MTSRNLDNRRVVGRVILILWIASFLLIWPGLHNAIIGQQTYSLDRVLSIAEGQSIFRFQADADNAIAQSRWQFHNANLKPGVTLDLLAPNFIKSSREIVQPDGSIAFQSVSQNNSSISLGIQQQLKATGATVFVSSELQRFDDFSLDAKQYNGIPLRIGVIQPIFGFNELKWNDRIEPLLVREADRKYIVDMEDIHLRATVRYFDLLESKVEENIAKTNSDVNEKLLDIARERYDLGKISKNELLQLELEYKSAIKNLSFASFQVEFSLAALFSFLGQGNPDSIDVLTPSPLTEDIQVRVDKALEEARVNRPEVINFSRRRMEAERDINKAKVDFGLQANVFASFGWARGSQRLGDIYTDPISEQQLQLSVSVPILDWGRKKAAVGIAVAQQDLVEQEIAQDQIDFENDIIQLVYRWDQLQTEIQLQAEIQEVSIDRFEISRQRYVLGDISITDLTLAQREKDQAQRNYIQSLRDYWITFYQIRKLTGYDFLSNQPIMYTRS